MKKINIIATRIMLILVIIMFVDTMVGIIYPTNLGINILLTAFIAFIISTIAAII